jgi:MFS family permease
MIPVSRSWRSLFFLCLCCSCWAFGFGLECPLASRWLQDLGRSSTFIGLNTSAHFLGVLLAGLIAPFLMRRSMRGCILAGLVLAGLGVAAFPLANAPFTWFLFRFLAGAGGAFAMIGLETLINLNAPPDRRAGDFALYACSVGIGFAFGSSIGLHLFSIDPATSFLVGGAVTLAAVPLLPLLPSFPRPRKRREAAEPLQAPFLSFASAWVQGFLEAGMLALLPLYLRSVGMADGAAGTLMGVVLFGVLLCQLPIGWLADRCGRERVLIACFLAVGLSLFLAPHAEKSVWLPFWLVVIGGCSGSFYPLGLALLGERLPAKDLPRANSRFVAMNCFGSLVCPLLSGPPMERFGPQAMFWTPAAVIACMLLAWAAGRFGRQYGRRFSIFRLTAPLRKTANKS